MPRDKNSDEQVKRIREDQKRFEENNKHYQDLANGKKTDGKIRQKIRLYEEQDGKCAYTGEPLELNLILNDSTAYEVDHILPVSISCWSLNVLTPVRCSPCMIARLIGAAPRYCGRSEP